MRSELVVDLFHHLGRLHHFEVGHAGRETEAQLEALALPMDVKRLLQWRWPVARVTVGPYTLSPAHDILKHDDLERLLAAHMVPVGDARNGDIVVIRFSETWEEIGLVSHDDLGEGESSPDEAYVMVCRSVDEFLYPPVKTSIFPETRLQPTSGSNSGWRRSVEARGLEVGEPAKPRPNGLEALR